MAQFGKASSKTRKTQLFKRHYWCGTGIVFLFGIVGWFFINLRNTGNYLKRKNTGTRLAVAHHL